MSTSSALEQEAKFWVPQLAAFRDHLEAQGARLVQPRTHEFNLRFDTPQQDLYRNQQVLRLRRDQRLTLTYKGPGCLRDGVLTRQEIELEIDDLERARQLLEALGYQVVMVYEKYRTVYRWHEVELALDETPLGAFVEIEGPSVECIARRARQLGLDLHRAVPESYAGLFHRARRVFQLPVTDLTFEALAPYPIDLHQLGLQPAWQATAQPASGS